MNRTIDRLQKPTQLEKILQDNKTIHSKMFENIKDAEFSRDAEGKITITYNSQKVSLEDDDTVPPVELKIPLPTNKNIIEKYDFGVIKFRNKSYVYSRTNEYREFQYYAAYAAKSDFFDLYNVLRNRITYDRGDERPRLEINLNPNQVTQAKLQEVLEDKYLKTQSNNPSEWHDNDRLLTLMYDLITKLSEPPDDATRIRIERTPYRLVFCEGILMID